jgi:hypothetical protein
VLELQNKCTMHNSNRCVWPYGVDTNNVWVQCSVGGHCACDRTHCNSLAAWGHSRMQSVVGAAALELFVACAVTALLKRWQIRLW